MSYTNALGEKVPPHIVIDIHELTGAQKEQELIELVQRTLLLPTPSIIRFLKGIVVHNLKDFEYVYTCDGVAIQIQLILAKAGSLLLNPNFRNQPEVSTLKIRQQIHMQIHNVGIITFFGELPIKESLSRGLIENEVRFWRHLYFREFFIEIHSYDYVGLFIEKVNESKRVVDLEQFLSHFKNGSLLK